MAERAASAVADTLHRHFTEALARRAAAREGAERALLQARLAALQSQARPAAAPPPARTAPAPGPLAALLQELRPATRPTSALAGQTTEPEMLQFFRSTWARLDAERRLHHALADAPENPGPLNSSHLVHQALQLMRACAPQYLQHFMAQVDALAWLEDAQAEAAAAKPASNGRTAARKTARAKKT